MSVFLRCQLAQECARTHKQEAVAEDAGDLYSDIRRADVRPGDDVVADPGNPRRCRGSRSHRIFVGESSGGDSASISTSILDAKLVQCQ